MTRVASRGLIVIMMAMMLLILLTACIEVPKRADSVKHQERPALWLYEKAPEEQLAALYKKSAGQAVQLIAEHVIPGSHRVHDDSLLFLGGSNELYYMPHGQDPHPLLADIEPYSYGFVNDGRKVFAVTRKRELILKTFGLEPQLIIDHVQHVIPLADRLIVLTDGGQVHAFDSYGSGMMIAEGAEALGATSDGRHAIIYLQSGVAYVTEPLPFYVVYAAHDRMKLMIADLTHRSVDVSLQADGRLHLAASDGMSKVYLRGGQDADAPERL